MRRSASRPCHRGCSVHSSSTWVAASTAASTSRTTRRPTTTGSAPTSLDAGPRARRDGRPLPRRQLRVRLQLGGRHRPRRRTAGPPRPRMEDRGDEPVRHRRVHALDASRRVRADGRRQPRHAGDRGGLQPARVRQPPRRHALVRPAGRRTAPRTRTACGCGASATRWTARGRSATRLPHEYGRLAAEVARAMRRVDPSIELVACGSSNSAHADVRSVGGDGAASTATTSSTTSRCTPTTSSTATTGPASWRRPSRWIT